MNTTSATQTRIISHPTHRPGGVVPALGRATEIADHAHGGRRLTNRPTPEISAPSRRRRGFVLILLTFALSCSSLMGSAGSASASSAAVATSYGMRCSANYGWVRQNYPNISVGTTYNQDVYFRAALQKYTSSGWQTTRTSVIFHGVSNYTGRKALGFWGGQPYYFAYRTSTGTYVGPELGPAFTYLSAGYYRTIETYWANGNVWSRYSYNADYPGYTYCYA